MNRFFRFLKEKKNKILAILFSALAVGAFLGYYLSWEILSEWTFFRSNPIRLWNFFIVLLTYGLLLVCNIRNDGFAYQGILMFVFYTAFSAFMDLLEGTVNVFLGGLEVLSYVLFFLFLVGKLVVGIFLYIYVARYMRGYSVSWKKIRLLGISYAAILTLAWGVYAGLGFAFGGLSLLAFLTLSFSEALIGWCIVFTLERLRRY